MGHKRGRCILRYMCKDLAILRSGASSQSNLVTQTVFSHSTGNCWTIWQNWQKLIIVPFVNSLLSSTRTIRLNFKLFSAYRFLRFNVLLLLNRLHLCPSSGRLQLRRPWDHRRRRIKWFVLEHFERDFRINKDFLWGGGGLQSPLLQNASIAKIVNILCAI